MAAKKLEKVRVNSNYIRDYLKQSEWSMVEVSKRLGKCKSWLCTALNNGEMEVHLFEFMCLLTDMDKNTAKLKDRPAEDKKILQDASEEAKKAFDVCQCMEDNTELIVSYIQDVGKIMSEINSKNRDVLEEVKGLREDLKNTTQTIINSTATLNGSIRDLLNYWKYQRK